MSLADVLRASRSRPAEAHRRKGATLKQHKYDARSIDAALESGERVVAFMSTIYGHETATSYLENITRRVMGSQPISAERAGTIVLDDDDEPAPARRRLPYGFWRRFFEEDLKQQFIRRKISQYQRALYLYVQRRAEGARTMTAMRGFRACGSCRSSGGSLNRQKASGLGFALLQWFVDHVQQLMTRCDVSLLMNTAREMRADLVHRGWPEAELPKLIGNAGAKWFQRWRKRYNIVKRVTGMKLTVSWRKVKRRISVLLSNIFRLRRLWELCHPGVEMRFISLDQKPSWFNNAGLTGTFAKKSGPQPRVRENFKKTRTLLDPHQCPLLGPY